MRNEIIEKTIYTFDELSEESKEKAREWYRDGAIDYEWWDYVYEDAKRMGEILGIEIDKIYFSGFSNQGDGACFEGSYSYAKGSQKTIRTEAPQDTTLHQVADDLTTLQKPFFYALEAQVKHNGHYYHELCTVIDVYDSEYKYSDIGDAEERVKESLRDFMQWIYSQLEKEYEWLMSDENIDENIIMNEYEFTLDGEIF